MILRNVSILAECPFLWVAPWEACYKFPWLRQTHKYILEWMLSTTLSFITDLSSLVPFLSPTSNYFRPWHPVICKMTLFFMALLFSAHWVKLVNRMVLWSLVLCVNGGCTGSVGSDRDKNQRFCGSHLHISKQHFDIYVKAKRY